MTRSNPHAFSSPAAIVLSSKMMVVFDGDSMTHRRCGPALDTWPYLHLMNWHGTWADEVSRLLFCWRPHLALRFNNAAVAGSSIRDLVARLESVIIPLKPQLVITSVGTNDATQTQGIPQAEFASLAITYIRTIQAWGGQVVFLVGFPGLDLKPRASCRLHLASLRRLARSQGACCLDIGTDLIRAARALQKQWPGHTIFSDGIHLNAVGATVVAGTVLRAMS